MILPGAMRSAMRSQARINIWMERGLGRPAPLQQRFASYQYQRFQQQRGFLRAWASQPTFYYQVAGFAGVVGAVYVANLETVPVSGRRRFNFISAEQEAQFAQQQYEIMMQEFGPRILPAYDSRVRQVRKVLSRLIPVSGLEDLDWQVHVVDSPEQNAMVIPGGKVFVFSGLLPVCDGEDGIATVLGHEIAHTVAHHAAERMSSGSILSGAVLLISGVLGFSQIQYSATRIMLDLGFDRPASRRQEEEADYIGLMMMAQACYDPERAPGLWARMQKENAGEPPQWLSTHPSSSNREQRLRGWLPEARNKRQQSDCASTLSYADDFKNAFTQIRW